MNIAHLHPVLVHLPIGVFIVATVLYLAHRLKILLVLPSTFISLMGLGVLFTTLSAITGVWQMVQSDIPVAGILNHIIGAVICLVLAILILLQHIRVKEHKSQIFLYALLFIGTIFTGHLGGTITHGSGYLFKFPLKTNTISHSNHKKHFVEIVGMKYNPARLNISSGDSVIFINKDLVPHDVVEDKQNYSLSPKLMPSNKWGTTFNKSVNYHCSFHPSMKGEIIVQEQ